MGLQQIVGLVASFGLLALAIHCVMHSAESVLARRLAFVSVALFTFTAADVAADVAGSVAWDRLDVAASSLTTPLMLDFVLEFVGVSAPRWRWGTFTWFGALSASCLVPFVWPTWEVTFTSEVWAALLLLGAVPPTIFSFWILGRHLRGAAPLQDRKRTALVLAAVGIMALLGTTDLWALMGAPVVRLSPMATLTTAVLLNIASLRFGLLSGKVGRMAFVAPAVLAAGLLLGYLAIFDALSAERAILPFASVVLAVLVAAAMRPAIHARAVARERTKALAALGRMSAQLAHDLRNPISAVRGAAQFLHGELEAGRPLTDKGDFLTLIVEQAERLEAITRTYQRVGPLEPRKESVLLGPFLDRLIAGKGGVAPGSVPAVRFVLAPVPEGLSVEADRELLGVALENLFQNAIEAMPSGGQLTVEVRNRGDRVAFQVADEGSGMAPDTLARAADDFFTTKSRGSGLGLALVRRVAEAHGGRMELSSRLGQGTVAQLELPL